MTQSHGGNEQGGHLSVEGLRERYRAERAKRLRADGIDQYAEVRGAFAEFDADPFVEPGFSRDAVAEDVDVVIIGAGFGGMLTGIDLRKAGFDSFRIIDGAGDVGGTWYWNRYPGAACDVESYVYLPLLEETGFMPTEKYSKAPEIFAYCQLLARTWDLYANALLQTNVSDVDWDDDAERWVVRTDRGDHLTAQFVVIAGGVLHRPKLPGIPGIETFAGDSFHTSRWSYRITGGGPLEPMEKLAGRRVGIIGTGATAVQVIPHVARDCEHLVVFQRTPASVGARNNRPTDPEWFRSLPAGWQWERIENFTKAVTGSQPDVDLIDDEWTKMMWVDTRRKAATPEEQEELDRIDFEHMEALRARIDEIVEDPRTAELLKPWYGQSCKRPCFHDEYLPTYNRPNVTLVDTDGKGVDRITPTGVVVDGVEHPVDVLIYASGFEVTTDYTHRLGFDPRGRGGVSLSDAWADGPHTLHGVLTRGFPNLLMISTVQGGQAVNFLHTITGTAAHVAGLVQRCRDEGIATIEPTDEAQDAWFAVLFRQMMQIADYQNACTPGYLNNEGTGDMRSARGVAYLGTGIDYLSTVESWRAAPELEGVVVTHRA